MLPRACTHARTYTHKLHDTHWHRHWHWHTNLYKTRTTLDHFSRILIHWPRPIVVVTIPKIGVCDLGVMLCYGWKCPWWATRVAMHFLLLNCTNWLPLPKNISRSPLYRGMSTRNRGWGWVVYLHSGICKWILACTWYWRILIPHICRAVYDLWSALFIRCGRLWGHDIQNGVLYQSTLIHTLWRLGLWWIWRACRASSDVCVQITFATLARIECVYGCWSETGSRNTVLCRSRLC